jgi:hypothetical protein
MSRRTHSPIPRSLAVPALSLLLAGVAAGCGGATISPPSFTDAGVADVPDVSSDTPLVVDLGAGCRLSDGTFCAVGASCPSPDGCNTCACGADGFAACTERACVDAGPPDVGPCLIDCAAPPPGCHYEGPVVCSPPSCGRLVCVDAGAPIVCGGSMAESFPSFDRSCGAAADCFVATHQTDCCGNSRAMGLRASERAAFDAAEAVCRPMFPGCGCPARPPVADDGNTGTFSDTIAVECRAGVCTSYVPTP